MDMMYKDNNSGPSSGANNLGMYSLLYLVYGYLRNITGSTFKCPITLVAPEGMMDGQT
jgi:hypothetical protein